MFPVGLVHLKRIATLLEGPGCGLPGRVVTECEDLLKQIAESEGRAATGSRPPRTERITERTAALKAMAAQTETARCLQTMPGVGPMTALAVEAFAPDMAEFKCGRDFAAWLGLVPRQHSSGGKARLGRISKAGQTDIRRLLIIGAMARIVGRAGKKVPAESWLGRMLVRKPKILVGIALANSERCSATGPSAPRMARQIWAMLTKEEDDRDPGLAAAA